MSNICSEESCSEAIRQGHYLCRPHWEAMQRGSISKCLGCGIAYKPAAAPLCAECEKKAQEKSRSLRDNPDIDSLVGVIKSLQEHINRDHANIGADETRTRNVLINPLLEALGWDPANPELVTTEYRLRFGYRPPPRADYALHPQGQQGKPIAFIEAKRMATQLSAEHRDQVFAYAASRKSVKYAVLTNGDQWEIHAVPGDAPPRLQSRFVLRSESAADCTRKLQPLVRASSGTGEARIPRNADTATSHVSPSAPRVAGSTVDAPKALAWLAIALVLGFIAGYIVGFQAAQPVLEAITGPLGAIVVGISVIAATALVWRFLPWGRLSCDWLRPGGSKTLIWASVAVVVGGVIGYFIGYSIGFRTAQPIYDMLAIVGYVAFGVIVIGGVVAIGIAVTKPETRRRR